MSISELLYILLRCSGSVFIIDGQRNYQCSFYHIYGNTVEMFLLNVDRPSMPIRIATLSDEAMAHLIKIPESVVNATGNTRIRIQKRLW